MWHFLSKIFFRLYLVNKLCHFPGRFAIRMLCNSLVLAPNLQVCALSQVNLKAFLFVKCHYISEIHYLQVLEIFVLSNPFLPPPKKNVVKLCILNVTLGYLRTGLPSFSINMLRIYFVFVSFLFLYFWCTTSVAI